MVEVLVEAISEPQHETQVWDSGAQEPQPQRV